MLRMRGRLYVLGTLWVVLREKSSFCFKTEFNFNILTQITYINDDQKNSKVSRVFLSFFLLLRAASSRFASVFF